MLDGMGHVISRRRRERRRLPRPRDDSTRAALHAAWQRSGHLPRPAGSRPCTGGSPTVTGPGPGSLHSTGYNRPADWHSPHTFAGSRWISCWRCRDKTAPAAGMPERGAHPRPQRRRRKHVSACREVRETVRRNAPTVDVRFAPTFSWLLVAAALSLPTPTSAQVAPKTDAARHPGHTRREIRQLRRRCLDGRHEACPDH